MQIRLRIVSFNGIKFRSPFHTHTRCSSSGREMIHLGWCSLNSSDSEQFEWWRCFLDDVKICITVYDCIRNARGFRIPSGLIEICILLLLVNFIGHGLLRSSIRYLYTHTDTSVQTYFCVFSLYLKLVVLYTLCTTQYTPCADSVHRLQYMAGKYQTECSTELRENDIKIYLKHTRASRAHSSTLLI